MAKKQYIYQIFDADNDSWIDIPRAAYEVFPDNVKKRVVCMADVTDYFEKLMNECTDPNL